MTETGHFKEIEEENEDKLEENTQRGNNSSMVEENQRLKRMNMLLKNQLHVLSESKNGKTKYKLEEKNTTNIAKSQKKEEVNFMELRNAYKQCHIYKKQANFYRKKLVTYEVREKAQQMYEWKSSQLEKENNKLREEIKYLVKINKKQEKGLESSGMDHFLGNAK